MHTVGPAERRTPSRSALVIVGMLALYSACRWWMTQVPAGSVPSILAALLPLPPMFYLYTAWILEALRGDELERRITLDALAIGFGATFAFVTLLSQLEEALPTGALFLDFGDVLFVALLATFFGMQYSRRRFE